MMVLGGFAWFQFAAVAVDAEVPPKIADVEVPPKASELERSAAVIEPPVASDVEDETAPVADVEEGEPGEPPTEEERTPSPMPIELEPEAVAPMEDDEPDWSNGPESEPEPPPVVAGGPPVETTPARSTLPPPVVSTPAESSEDLPEVASPRIVGTVRVRSQYALSITNGDVRLAEEVDDVSVELEVGSQEIVLFAPEVFLNQTFAIEVEQGQTSYFYAPELGRASIRAFPENGSLTIDGLVAKDLPLTDMPIVEGSHTFRFEWPNGRSSEQTVVVQKGQRVYVTGQPGR
jgi:hypothetical protein